jgi:hypothetical protein
MFSICEKDVLKVRGGLLGKRKITGGREGERETVKDKHDQSTFYRHKKPS